MREISAHPPPGVPPRAEVAGVPYIVQEKYQCGPAALAMAVNAAGGTLSADALVPQVWLPRRKGSVQPEMLAAARRHGFVAMQIAPGLPALLAELAAGHPVIVLQNRGLDWYPVWHYAVVTGYDLNAGLIGMHSGTAVREDMSLNTFEHTWARAGHWGMLALAPGTLPVGRDPAPYLHAVAALERAGGAAQARTAYAAALIRWPGNVVALMGLGNTAYAQHDLVAAEQAFRRAIALQPRSVAALNNLAQTLHDKGSDDEALEFARRAVRIDGPLRSEAQRTLDAIASRDLPAH